GLAGGVELARAADEPNVPVALEREQAPGGAGRVRRRDVLADRLVELGLHASVGSDREVRLVLAGGRREQREDPAGEAAGAGPREIEMALGTAAGEVGRVVAGEGVVVTVEDGDHRGVRPQVVSDRARTAPRSRRRTSR